MQLIAGSSFLDCHGWRRYSLRKGTLALVLYHGRSVSPLALEWRTVENCLSQNCNIFSVLSIILIIDIKYNTRNWNITQATQISCASIISIQWYHTDEFRKKATTQQRTQLSLVTRPWSTRWKLTSNLGVRIIYYILSNISVIIKGTVFALMGFATYKETHEFLEILDNCSFRKSILFIGKVGCRC